MGYVLEVPVDAVEEGGDGGGVDVDVAGGAGDVEGVGLVGVESEVELGGEVGHEAVEDGFGGGDGGRGLRGGLGGCGEGMDGKQYRGAAEKPKGKHGNTISPERRRPKRRVCSGGNGEFMFMEWGVDEGIMLPTLDRAGWCMRQGIRAGVGWGCAALLLMLLVGGRAWGQAGPPFQTDDPTPVDLGHYEAYVFGQADGTPAEMDAVGPAFEFNWGAVPNIQLHAILPLGGVWPSNNPAYLPGGVGASAFGITDVELGFKWGFINRPSIDRRLGPSRCLRFLRGVMRRGWGWGRCGTSCRFGRRRSLGRGVCAAGWGIRWCRRWGIRTFCMADF